MKTIICTGYGGPLVLQIKEVEKPVPAENDVLIKVMASSVTRYDCWARSAISHTGMSWMMRLWFGFTKPKQPVLGTEFSGIVEAVGALVVDLKPGDKVCGYTGMEMGSYAEYISVSIDKVVPKPENVSFEAAAGVMYGALTALYFLRMAELRKGQKILILGASGGVGTYAVQLAKNLFEAEVTGVCSSTKIDFVRSLGAEKVIDYTREDFTELEDKYDMVFDTFGKSSFSGSKILKKNGTYLWATYGLRQLMHMAWLKLTSKVKIVSPLLKESKEDMTNVTELIDSGKLKPVVDKVFSFNKASQAHEYFENGGKKGSVIIRIGLKD